MKQLRLLLLFALVAGGLGIAQNKPATTAASGAPQSPTAIATPLSVPATQTEMLLEQSASSNDSSWAILDATGDIAGAAPSPPIPPELRNAGDINLPLRDSPLPLLSLIGFCLLIGAAAHALRAPKSPTSRAAL